MARRPQHHLQQPQPRFPHGEAATTLPYCETQPMSSDGAASHHGTGRSLLLWHRHQLPSGQELEIKIPIPAQFGAGRGGGGGGRLSFPEAHGAGKAARREGLPGAGRGDLSVRPAAPPCLLSGRGRLRGQRNKGGEGKGPPSAGTTEPVPSRPVPPGRPRLSNTGPPPPSPPRRWRRSAHARAPPRSGPFPAVGVH